MKRISLFFTLVIMLSLAACGSGNANPSENLTESRAPLPTTESTETVETEGQNQYYAVDYFIDEYNKNSENSIVDVIEIDITDKNSEYYQTEFRLSAFKDAPAKLGKIGDATIIIVNYGAMWRDGLRIYVFSPSSDGLEEIFHKSALIFDDSITGEEIAAAFSEIENCSSFLLGDNITGIIGVRDNTSHFMLDDGLYLRHTSIIEE